MVDLLTVLTPIALIDSTSVTPLGLVPLATVLAGRRPYRTAFAFILGLFVSYVIMALAFLFGLSAVFMRLNAWMTHRWHHPEPMDFLLELILGLVLVFLGVRIADARRRKGKQRELPAQVSPAAAFGFGFVLNVVGFPGALPYFAAADQILRADPPPSGMVLAVLYYVLLFVLPLTGIVLLRALLGSRGDAFMRRIQGFFDTWGRRVLIVLLITLGLVMIADSAAYLLRSRPLIPIGWPTL